VNVTGSALRLIVEDESASADFLVRHFGFVRQMTGGDFVSVLREDAGATVVFLRRGRTVIPGDRRDVAATGVGIDLIVDDLAGEATRLEREGVEITMPMRVESWGERRFQVRDPNGLVVQLVDWKG